MVSDSNETDHLPGVRRAAEHFRFGYLVHDVSRTRRTLMDAYMRPAGITRSQWSMLSVLWQSDDTGLSQVSLAGLLDLGKASAGALVDRLEAAGYVERRPDPVDRRAKLIYMTHKGHDTIRLMIRMADRINEKILKNVSEDNLRLVEDVLDQIKDNIKSEIAKLHLK